MASGASGYSAGMLTPYSGSNDPGLLALSGASLKLHAELAEELPRITGIDHGYDMVPYLRCAFAETGFDVARQFMEDRVADGLDAEWLTGDEAREVCDWLSDEVEGACLTAIEPSVDSRLLTQSAFEERLRWVAHGWWTVRWWGFTLTPTLSHQGRGGMQAHQPHRRRAGTLIHLFHRRRGGVHKSPAPLMLKGE